MIFIYENLRFFLNKKNYNVYLDIIIDHNICCKGSEEVLLLVNSLPTCRL